MRASAKTNKNRADLMNSLNKGGATRNSLPLSVNLLRVCSIFFQPGPFIACNLPSFIRFILRFKKRSFSSFQLL